MYCKKCRFHSFDHVGACPKCGADWEETRKSLYLNWITASGVNWVAPAPAKAETAQTATVGADDEFVELIGQTPEASSSGDSDIDVSLFPELDFSMESPAPQAPSKPAAATPAPAAPRKEEELFLDAMPVDDVTELDFSASFDTPSAPTPPLSKPKREDLFIPELEEMLAPLTEEPRQNPAPAKKASFSEESEILLDFGNDSSGKKSTSDADDIPFLNLDDTNKQS